MATPPSPRVRLYLYPGAIWSYGAVNPYLLCLSLSLYPLYPFLVLHRVYIIRVLRLNISVFQFRGRHNFATR